MKWILRRTYLLAAIATLAFACGVVVGQEKPPHLGKYMVPSQATELDRVFLSMEVEDMQNSLGLLQEVEMPNQMGVPTYYFNPKAGKIQGVVNRAVSERMNPQ